MEPEPVNRGTRLAPAPPPVPPVPPPVPAEPAAAKKKDPAVANPATSISGSTRPVIPAAAASAPAGRPRSEDLRIAMSEPAVREAMEVFEGQLVNVKRTAPDA